MVYVTENDYSVYYSVVSRTSSNVGKPLLTANCKTDSRFLFYCQLMAVSSKIDEIGMFVSACVNECMCPCVHIVYMQ